MKIESILAKIAEDVFQSTNFVEAKKNVLVLLENSHVKDRDKMIKDVTATTSLIKLQTYFANSLLKYEGLSLIKTKKDVEN